MLTTFLSGFGTGAGLIVAIGAQNAFVLRQGLLRQFVLPVVLVCIFGDVLCISAGVAGMGAVVKVNAWLMELFRWGGAAFLAVYGAMAARRAWTGGSALQAGGETAASLAKAVTACLAFTFLNPHVYLDTVVLLGSIAAQYGDARWVFAAGAIAASVVWFTGLGFGARLLQPVFANPKAWQVLDGLIAVVMWAIAATLAAHPLA